MGINTSGPQPRLHLASVFILLIVHLHNLSSVLGLTTTTVPGDEGVNCTAIVQNVEFLPEQHNVSQDAILCLDGGEPLCLDARSDELEYAVRKGIDSHLVRVRRNSLSQQCLYLANETQLPQPNICVTLEARRENYPEVNDTLNVCVTFNYPPSLQLPNSALEWNVVSMSASESFSLDVVDVNATGIRRVSIAEVQPERYNNLFSIADPSLPVLTVLRPEVARQLEIVIEVNLTDAGFPPLSDSQTYKVTFYNDTLSCQPLQDVYVNVQDAELTQVNLTSCVSSSGFDVNYGVNNPGGLEVNLDNSTLLLLPPNSTRLGPLPQVVQVELLATSKSRTAESLVLPVHLGLPPDPTGDAYSLSIVEGTPVGEAATVYQVQCRYCGDVVVRVVSLDGSAPPVNVTVLSRTPVDVNSSSPVQGGTQERNSTLFNMRGSVSVISRLRNSGHVYYLAVLLRNRFGETRRNLTVRVVDDPEPPQFLVGHYSASVLENATTGTLLVSLSVVDPNLRGRLLLNLTDMEMPVSALPIALRGTDVIVVGKLNATSRQEYRLRVTAQDSLAPSSIAHTNVTVVVDDVNEPPRCDVTDLVLTVDVSESPGSTLAELRCHDYDLDPENRDLSYEFADGTPSVITDHLEVSQGIIRVSKPLVDAYSAWPRSTGQVPTFILKVKDDGTPEGLLEIPAFVNLTDADPPMCEDPVTVNVTENSMAASNCTPTVQSCHHPSGTPISYSILTAPNSSLYLENDPRAPNGSFRVCFAPPIVPGTFQVAMGATAFTVQTPFQLTLNVLDSNQAPRFLGPRPLVVNVSERAGQTQLLALSVEDPDLGSFGSLTFSASAVNGSGGSEIEFLPGGVFRVAGRLNASVTSEYLFNVTVTDGGGLEDTILVRILVDDVNDAPVCSVSSQLRVNVTQPAPGIIGQVLCYDYDVEPDFKRIVYSVEGIWKDLITVNDSGFLILLRSLPTDEARLQITVLAQDGLQTAQTQSWSGNVTLLINRDFPPECDAPSLTSEFSEKETLCSVSTLTCNNPASTSLTWVLGSGNLTSALEVRPVTSTDQQLTLRLCVTAPGSNISSYYTNVVVGNELGNTTVRLYANIYDVNDSPYFLQPRYEVSVPDDARIGSTLAFVLVKTDRFGVVNIPSNIYAYDPDTSQAFKIKTINAEGRATLKEDPSVTVNGSMPIRFMGNAFRAMGRLNNSLDYRFTVWAIDGGNLTNSTELVFNISDVNQAPSCDVTANSFAVSLADDPADVTGLPRIHCTDDDYLTEFRQVTFSVEGDGKPYFDVSASGEVSLIAKLPRDRETLNLTLRGSDGGKPPKFDDVTIQVQILRNVSAVCNPSFRYPPTWVIGSCLSVLPQCRDPSLAPGVTPTLTYGYQGNYTQGFDINVASNGTAELCYKLTVSGEYTVELTVDNGLEPVTVPLSVEVEYLRSTPQFSLARYVTRLLEDAAIGYDVITVEAVTQGNFSGNITYSIIEVAPQEADGAFRLDVHSGEITLAASLRPYVGDKITVTIQATDDLSLLTSSVLLEVSVDDVNDPPVCFAVPQGEITVSAALGTSAVVINCTDPDVLPHFRALSFTLTAMSENSAAYFAVTAMRADPSQGVVSVKAELPIQGQHDLAVHVNDGNNTVSVNVSVPVKLQPPPPTLRVTSANSSSIGVAWSFRRPEYRNLVVSYTLQYSTGQAGDRPSVVALTANDSSHLLNGLDPDTSYRLTLITSLTQGMSVTSDISASTLEVPVLSNMLVAFRVVNEAWDSALADPSSPASQLLASTLAQLLRTFFIDNGVPGVHRIHIIGFRSGSVLVDGVISVNQTGNITQAAQRFTQASVLGNYNIDQPTVSFGDSSLNITALETEGVDPSQLTEGQEVSVVCTARAVSARRAQPSFRWSLDGAPVQDSQSGRLSMRVEKVPGDAYGFRGVLAVRDLRPLDAGKVTCAVTLNEQHSVNKSLDVDVIRLPEVTLLPHDVILRAQEPFSLTCNVIRPRNHPFNITWYKDSVLINPQDTTILSSHQVRLNVTTAENATYGCQATNAAGSSTTVTASVSLVPQPVCECPADGQWQATPCGLTLTLECGPGLSGTMRRSCLQGGVWSRVNRTLCRRDTLVEIADKVRQVRDGVQVNSTELLVTELAALTETGGLGAGDLNLSIAVLEDVQAINSNSSLPIPQMEIQSFVSTADNILTQDADEWQFVQKTDRSRPGALLRTVEKMGSLASRRQNYSSPVFGSKAIVLEVGRSRAQDIYFPKPDAQSSLYPPWVMGEGSQALLRHGAFASMLSGSEELSYSGIYYRNLSDLVDLNQYASNRSDGSAEEVNSRILSFSVALDLTVLDPPLQLTFKHIRSNATSPSCNFLDLSDMANLRWSTEGCRVNSSNATHTVCQCDHLTNFAILMSPGTASETDTRILSIISLVGCSISIFCLLVTIIVNIVLWRYVKSDRSVILMMLCVTLLLCYVIFLAGVTQTTHKAVCTTVAALLHYLYLVAFCLMLAEGIEVLISVVYVFATRSRLWWLSLMAWGCPAIIVGTSLGISRLEGYGGNKFCWLSLESNLLWAFVGPALAVILTNFIVVIIVIKTMMKTTAMLTKTVRERSRAAVKAICVLMPVMGLTWVFGVFSVNRDLVVFQYLFTICNSLQGLLIFIFHCCLSRQIQDGMKSRKRRYKSRTPYLDTKSTTQGHTTSKSTVDSDKHNDLDKKVASPFLEADREVQQMVDKLSKVDNNNLQEFLAADKAVTKSNLPPPGIEPQPRYRASLGANIFHPPDSSTSPPLQPPARGTVDLLNDLGEGQGRLTSPEAVRLEFGPGAGPTVEEEINAAVFQQQQQQQQQRRQSQEREQRQQSQKSKGKLSWGRKSEKSRSSRKHQAPEPPGAGSRKEKKEKVSSRKSGRKASDSSTSGLSPRASQYALQQDDFERKMRERQDRVDRIYGVDDLLWDDRKNKRLPRISVGYDVRERSTPDLRQQQQQQRQGSPDRWRKVKESFLKRGPAPRPQSPPPGPPRGPPGPPGPRLVHSQDDVSRFGLQQPFGGIRVVSRGTPWDCPPTLQDRPPTWQEPSADYWY